MDSKMVSLHINDIPVTVPAGTTVLEAARSAGFNIPSLCFLKGINEIGACRICVVEVKGARSLVASCVYPVSEGMEVYTNTERVRKSRRLTLELILSNHRMDCLTRPQFSLRAAPAGQRHEHRRGALRQRRPAPPN